MDVAGDLVGSGEAVAHAVVPDLDAGHVLGLEAELDPAPGQGGVHLVAIPGERDDGGGIGLAGVGPAERLEEQLGRDLLDLGGVEEALERGLAGLGVHLLVVRLVDPGREQVVERRQGVDALELGLDEELAVDGAQNALPFSPTLRLSG